MDNPRRRLKNEQDVDNTNTNDGEAGKPEK